MDGILNINKPTGPTSFDIVRTVKRLAGESRVGHGGTLDPLAFGVLPVFLGQATRVAEFMLEQRKTYRAEIELGTETDTYDAEGKIIARADPYGVTLQQIEVELLRFLGLIEQVPPAYSALKKNGRPLYKLARQGAEFNLSSRPVNIYRLEVLGYHPPRLGLEIECSQGTYIRSIAHDVGRGLGVGAFLNRLERTRYGQFNIINAITVEELQAVAVHQDWANVLRPLDFILSAWPKITLHYEGVEAIRRGQTLPSEIAGERICAYDAAGHLVALLKLVDDRWQPWKVFAATNDQSEHRFQQPENEAPGKI